MWASSVFHMGRKKGGSNAKAAFYCWYCGDDRTFADEGILIEHQRARHFKCNTCHKRMQTWSSLRLHCSAVHKVEINLVENAIPERADFPGVIVGMDGVPDDDWREQAQQAEKRRKLEEAKVAAGVAPMPRPAPPPPPMMSIPVMQHHPMQQFQMQHQMPPQMPMHPPPRPPPPPGAPPMMPPSMTPPGMGQGMQPHFAAGLPQGMRPGMVGMGMPPPPMYPPGMMRPPGPPGFGAPGMGTAIAQGMLQHQQQMQEQQMQHMQQQQQQAQQQHEQFQQGQVQQQQQLPEQHLLDSQAAVAGSSSLPSAGASSSSVPGVHMIYVDELVSMEERRASLSKYRFDEGKAVKDMLSRAQHIQEKLSNNGLAAE